ncbi:multidrug effflux MFS transporter [uncultured Roseobacter sp.]|uniref:multidrug effflux MFS transporter n=1 Tax=uncultured Roseobacter sp. TaxID=114847 RepID=UPI003446E3B3
MGQCVKTEYLLLISSLSAISALGTDILLPGLNLISDEFHLPEPVDIQYAVSGFFLGMALGQLFVGPLSDRFGRKPVVQVGYAVFVFGCALSIFAQSWIAIIAARFLQGLGAAAPRVVSMAIVRDEHDGTAMARILSITMAVFILVPIIAPALGQGLIYLGGWRATHVALAVLSILVVFWFTVRQPETLQQEDRISLGGWAILSIVSQILRSRQAFGYTVALGLITGAFVSYLSTAQAIFLGVFETGDLFAFYFALSAASLGAAALLNSWLVSRFDMVALTKFAMLAIVGVSLAFLAVIAGQGGVPPLWQFMGWLLAVFFCLGLIYGNLQALALEPLGHIAGSASAFVGSISLLISLPLSAVISAQINGTVYPLVTGFALLGIGSALVIWLVHFGQKIERAENEGERQ